jgi:hypothetical protein
MKPQKHSIQCAVCAGAAILVMLPTLHAQTSDIPIKPGLWETQVIVKIGETANAPVSSKYCFSAGTTLSAYLSATIQAAPGGHCSTSNKIQTAHGIALDAICTSQTMNSTGHLDFHVPDTEHFSGTSHTTVTGASHAKPINMTIDKTFAAKFVTLACGDVKPLVLRER